MSDHTCAAWRYNDGPGRNCEGCRRAYNAYTQDLKNRRKVGREDVGGRPTTTRGNLPHGSASTYNNHGCRCKPCTQANADARRDRRHRNG